MVVTQAAQWPTFTDVRQTFGSADQVKVASGRIVIAFDIAGNRCCRVLVPRPIHDRIAYENGLEVIEAMSGFEQSFDEDQGDYFAVIADFVSAYEDAKRAGGDSRQPPLESLKYLLEENAMTAADLSRLIGADRTLGAKILRGERILTMPHLRILAARFKVSPALFI